MRARIAGVVGALATLAAVSAAGTTPAVAAPLTKQPAGATSMGQDTALIVGATGLVGSHCLKALLDSGYYERVIALTRRPLATQHPRFVQMLVDFEKLDQVEPFPAGDVFCARAPADHVGEARGAGRGGAPREQRAMGAR